MQEWIVKYISKAVNFDASDQHDTMDFVRGIMVPTLERREFAGKNYVGRWHAMFKGM